MRLILSFLLVFLTLGGCGQLASTLGSGGIGANSETANQSAEGTSDDDETGPGPSTTVEPGSVTGSGATPPFAVGETGSTPFGPSGAGPIIEQDPPAGHNGSHPPLIAEWIPPVPGGSPPASADGRESGGPLTMTEWSPGVIEPKTDQVDTEHGPVGGLTKSYKVSHLRITRSSNDAAHAAGGVDEAEELDLGLLVEASKIADGNLVWTPAPVGAQVKIIFIPAGQSTSARRQTDATVGPVGRDGKNVSFPNLSLAPGVISFYYLENLRPDFRLGPLVPLDGDGVLRDLERDDSVHPLESFRLRYR